MSFLKDVLPFGCASGLCGGGLVGFLYYNPLTTTSDQLIQHMSIAAIVMTAGGLLLISLSLIRARA